MIISATVIHRPRWLRYCAHCDQPIYGAVLRLYGYGETGDPPYVLWLHPGCNRDTDPKILTVLAVLTESVTSCPSSTFSASAASARENPGAG